MSTVEPCVKRTSSTGDTIAMWRSEPAPIQTTVLERSVRSMKIGTPAGGGNGPTPPGDTPVARHERQHRPVGADEDERLHDLVEIAPDRLGSALRRCGGRREFFEPRFCTRGTEKDGNALHGLGPGHCERPKRAR